MKKAKARADIRSTVAAEMPGWVVVETGSPRQSRAKSRGAADGAASHTDAVSPDIAALKDKYLRGTGKGGVGGKADVARSAKEPEPTGKRLAWAQIREKSAQDAAVGTKTILYDPETNEIKAVQG